MSDKESEHLQWTKLLIDSRIDDIAKDRHQPQHSHSWHKVDGIKWPTEGLEILPQERVRMFYCGVFKPLPGVRVEATIELTVTPREGVTECKPPNEGTIESSFESLFESLKKLDSCSTQKWDENAHTMLATARERLSNLYWKIFANNTAYHRSLLNKKQSK